MRLYKRGNVWWVRWGERGIKRRISTHCTDRKAAELYARKLQRQLADPAHHAANEATVQGALLRFLDELKHEDVADGTRHMYRVKAGHLGRLLGRQLGAHQGHTRKRALGESRKAE